MLNYRVFLLLLISLVACTSKSKPSTPPVATETPIKPGTNPGNPSAKTAQLAWEVVDAAKFGHCAGALTAQLKLKNSGAGAASWTLKQHEKSGLSFVPAQGLLEPQGEVTIAVTGTLTAADLDIASGKTNIEVIALYEKGEARLKIQEDVQGVLLQSDAKSLDFGVVAAKDQAEHQLTLTNLGKTDTQLRFAANSDFIVNPEQLTLNSGGSQTINVIFKPLENRYYSKDLVWTSSKPICTGFNPLVKLQGQGSTVFTTDQKTVEWNQRCDRSPVSETQDVTFGLRRNAESLVILEGIEGPFTVDAKEWTVAAKTQGLVKVSFNSQSLQPGTYHGRLSLKDKATGEIVSFDLRATVIGSYLEIGSRSNGTFTSFDSTRGIEFFSSQVLSSYASSPFNLDFVNRGNRPLVVKFSLESPVKAPFMSFPETSLTIQPGLGLTNSFPLWLQTHNIGKWDSRMNFRYEHDADAPLCNQPPAELPLHYTVSEDLDVEARAAAATYTCGTNGQPEFFVDLTNRSSRTVYVKAWDVSNTSRSNSQSSSVRVEGVTLLRQSSNRAEMTNFNEAYPLKKGESVKVIIKVTNRKEFESTFKTGEKLSFNYDLRPADSEYSMNRSIDVNVDVNGAFLAVSPLALNFGTVVGDSKVTQTFQIRNDGTTKAALTLNSLVNGFSIVSPTSQQLEINPADTALVTVAYTGSSFLNGTNSWKLDLGGAANSCYSTEKVVNLSAINSAEGLSFESPRSTFALSRGESMGPSCDDIPLKSSTHQLENRSGHELRYKVSLRLNESLLKHFTASELMALQVDGQNADADKVFTIPAYTYNFGPQISLVWLKDIRTLSSEKYRVLAEAQDLGAVVVSYADAAGKEVTLPIVWTLARVIPSVAHIDFGVLTKRSPSSFPFELKVLQNFGSFVDITTEFKDGSPGLTVSTANPKLHTSVSEVLKNSIQVELDPTWQAPSLSGSLKITAKELLKQCPLLSEFSLPVRAQVKIRDVVVDSESPRLTVEPVGKDFRVTSYTDCGSQSDEKTIRIKNNGNYPIKFSDFQWEELAEASPFALTSSPSDLQKALEPGETLFVKYQPLQAQRQDYYKEAVNLGYKHTLKASLSADGEASEVKFFISDLPRGFYLSKALFTSPLSFRQIEVKGNAGLKSPDFVVPFGGTFSLKNEPSKWTISSDFGEVQSEAGWGSRGKLNAFMQFPAGFSGTAKMIWTISHATLKNCSPNSFPIEGTTSSESIDVSLDPGNTLKGTARSDSPESSWFESQDAPGTAQLNFDRGQIFCGPNSQEQFVNVTNNTSQSLRLLGTVEVAAEWLPLQSLNPTIEPGKTGRIRISVDSSLVDAFGRDSKTGRYDFSLVAKGAMPARFLGSLRIIQTAEIDGKIIKAYVDGKELVPGRNVVNFGAVSRHTTAKRDIEWRIIGKTGSNQLEFRKSLVAPISDGTPESKLLDAFGSTIEREIFTDDRRTSVLSFLPTVSGDHSVKLQVVGGPAMKNICSAPTIEVRGQGL